MNQVLQRIKSQMPKDKLALTNAFEKAGLFDKGAAWEHGRYPSEYATLAWGWGISAALWCAARSELRSTGTEHLDGVGFVSRDVGDRTVICVLHGI